MSITWSVRMRLLLVPFAAAALTVGCGEGHVLQSPTGPSGTVASSTFLTADAADGSIATAASTDEFGMAKGGRGKGGSDTPDDAEEDIGPGSGHKPDKPGRSHEDRVVGFVSANAADALTVNGITVIAAANAVIRHGNRILTMADIVVGNHIQARGTMEGTTLTATEIKVQPTGGDDEGDEIDDDDDEDDEDGTQTSLKGAISSLSDKAGCPVVTFMIGTTKVTTSAATTFDDVACSALANGALVEVTGTKQPDGSILAKKVEAEAAPDEVKGIVFELTGTASCGTGTPALTFKVGKAGTATTVKTTATTAFVGVTCATLANGANVEVEGTKQADGSITAASVELH